MEKLYILFIFSLLSIPVNAQYQTFKIEDSGITAGFKSHNDGKILISQDEKILQIVKRHKEINNNKFPGWRVQIYFGSGQKAMIEAQNTKSRFLTKYGEGYSAYIIYDSPFYKIRVGDFRTRAEALYFKDQIKFVFPDTWIVQERINYPITTLNSGE
jgi:hypothetical protein